MSEPTKVGIISCSGEELAAGTISRLATRRVLEVLRPRTTVTLCLPLFLAGEEQERRFAREHPTITVDGCSKLCAKRGTEQHSGKVAASLDVSELVGDRLAKCHRSARDFDNADQEAVWIVAERIAAEVDALATAPGFTPAAASTDGAACCSCGAPPPEQAMLVAGRSITIPGLPLVFEHLYKTAVRPADGFENQVLDTVRIYHAIEPGEEQGYRAALADAYREFCTRKER